MEASKRNSFNTASRGRELYERELSAFVEQSPANTGKLLALDVDTGDYCIGQTSFAAVRDLKSRRPGATVHVIRVGSPTAVRIGASRQIPTPAEPE